MKIIDFKNSDFWKLLRPPLIQFSKFKNLLWVCWYLGKNLFNFVPPFENSTKRIAILCNNYLNFSSNTGDCKRIRLGTKPKPPYGLEVFKGYKNVMIRRDFANFLINHPVAKAFEEYLHDTLVPDEHLYATLGRILDVKSIIDNK